MAQYQHDLNGVFQALADPTRRAVLGRLGQGPASITELAQPFDMALPSFMKHIRLLESSGWIRTHKSGRVRTCAIEKKQFTVAESWLAEQRAVWEGRTDRLEQFVMADQARNSGRTDTSDHNDDHYGDDHYGDDRPRDDKDEKESTS